MRRSCIEAPINRFCHLDGLRGLAALYVVLHHAYVAVAWSGAGLPASMTRFMKIFDHGTLAVDVFIVLSGFVLMMPLLTTPDRALRGGVGGFIRRRARRILPAHYGALAVCLALIALVPMLSKTSNSRWDDALPAFDFGTIASHVFLVHNLSSDWIWRIDNPMWSVATEWQIYFVFALVLVPIWRRYGMTATACAALTIGALLETYMPPSSEACFHFIGLFSFGMIAASVALQRRRANWRAIANFACLGMIAAILFVPTLTRQPKIVVDSLVGVAAAVMIAATATLELRGTPCWINRVLASGPARKLGAFSYSLYLMHYPLLALGNLLLRDHTSLSPASRVAVLMGVGTPVTIALCYVFYRIFERPFMTVSEAPAQRNEPPAIYTAENIRVAA